MLSLTALGVAGFVALLPTPADACSPPPAEGIEVAILSNGEAVHRDGAILLRVTDYDLDATDAAEEITISVTRDEQDVPGTLELLDIVGEASNWEHNVIGVWRPDAEFVPTEDYDVSVSYEDVWEGGTVWVHGSFSVVDAPAPSLESVTASVSDEVVVGGPLHHVGERICCTTDDSCGESTECVTELERESVRIRGDYDLGDADDQYILRRLYYGLDGVADQRGLSLTPGTILSDGYTPIFSQAFGSYCIAVEAVDVLHGTSIMSEVACLDAPADLVLAETPFDVETWAQRCLDEPYWEESGEPYGDDGETDGGSDSDTDGPDSDTDGPDAGSDSDTDGPDADSDTDGTPTTDDGPESGSDTDGDAGASGSDGGCSVRGEGSGGAWAWLGVLCLGGLFRRRRR